MTDQPQPVIALPQPVIAQPQPVTTQPQPVTAQLQPAKAQPYRNPQQGGGIEEADHLQHCICCFLFGA